MNWLLQQPSQHLFQKHWDHYLELFDKDTFKLFNYGTFIFSFFPLWLAAIPFSIIDLTGKPAFLLKYKIQAPNGDYPVTWAKLKNSMTQILFNQFVAQIPFTLMMSYVAKWRNIPIETLPSFPMFLFESGAFLLVLDISYYYIHRLFHTPFLYKHFHRVHHEYRTPIAISAFYVHPIEYCFGLLLPFYLGPLIVGSHLATIYFWEAFTTISIMYYHSGYHLPFLNSNEAHDYHHLKKNTVYGISPVGIMDLLYGTDSMFRKSQQFKRHVRLFGIKPAKETYPDQLK